MSIVDRRRAARLIEAAGLDALVIAEPEGFHYVTGVSQGVAGLFRRAGAGFAILPADPARPIGAVIGDLAAAAASRTLDDVRTHPLWIELADLSGPAGEAGIEAAIAAGWRQAGRAPGFARPATFDLRLALAALGELLALRGLDRGRLGFDFDYVAASDAAVIRDALPGAVLRNGSPVLDRIRMVKTPLEIERLTLGVELAEAGLRALTRDVASGETAADLRLRFRGGIADEARQRGVPVPPAWDYIAIGPDPWSPDGCVAPQAIIKADVGCVVEGYSSDTSRNHVFGAPTRDQARLHRSLETGFAAGLAAIRPGVPLKAVHRATTAALEDAGLENFSRGHFGHSLGHAVFSEQWPFIAADTEVLIEPDMVLAFEVPIYVNGLGAFNLEDQILVTEDSWRSMNRLPHGLMIL